MRFELATIGLQAIARPRAAGTDPRADGQPTFERYVDVEPRPGRSASGTTSKPSFAASTRETPRAAREPASGDEGQPAGLSPGL